jgi:hypothetical protein
VLVVVQPQSSKELDMESVASRSPFLIPSLLLAERALNSPLGSAISSFHVHSVDDTLSETYTESVIGTFCGRPVRSIRSLPSRPIALGTRTQPGHIDHVGVDVFGRSLPSFEEFDGLCSLYPDARILKQDHPNCCGILVARKLWMFAPGYPPLEFQLGPKTEGTVGCDPRPAWPGEDIDVAAAQASCCGTPESAPAGERP